MSCTHTASLRVQTPKQRMAFHCLIRSSHLWTRTAVDFYQGICRAQACSTARPIQQPCYNPGTAMLNLSLWNTCSLSDNQQRAVISSPTSHTEITCQIDGIDVDAVDPARDGEERAQQQRASLHSSDARPHGLSAVGMQEDANTMKVSDTSVVQASAPGERVQTVLLGVDPDVHGSMAVLTWEGPAASDWVPPPAQLQVQLFDAPFIKYQLKGKRKGGVAFRKLLDVRRVAELVRRVVPAGGTDRVVLRAVLEMPWIQPLNGSISCYNSGYNAGVWHAVLQAAGFALCSAKARAWKSDMALIGKTKDASRELAVKLFPSVTPLLKRKRDHGRAEGVLLAAWGAGISVGKDGTVLHGTMPQPVVTDGYGNFMYDNTLEEDVAGADVDLVARLSQPAAPKKKPQRSRRHLHHTPQQPTPTAGAGLAETAPTTDPNQAGMQAGIEPTPRKRGRPPKALNNTNITKAAATEQLHPPASPTQAAAMEQLHPPDSKESTSHGPGSAVSTSASTTPPGHQHQQQYGESMPGVLDGPPAIVKKRIGRPPKPKSTQPPHPDTPVRDNPAAGALDDATRATAQTAEPSGRPSTPSTTSQQAEQAAKPDSLPSMPSTTSQQAEQLVGDETASSTTKHSSGDAPAIPSSHEAVATPAGARRRGCPPKVRQDPPPSPEAAGVQHTLDWPQGGWGQQPGHGLAAAVEHRLEGSTGSGPEDVQQRGLHGAAARMQDHLALLVVSACKPKLRKNAKMTFEERSRIKVASATSAAPQPATTADAAPMAAAATLQTTAETAAVAAVQAAIIADAASAVEAATLQPTTTDDAAVAATLRPTTTDDAAVAATLRPTDTTDGPASAVASALPPSNNADPAPTATSAALQMTKAADAPPTMEGATLQPTNPADVTPTAAAPTLQPTTSADVAPTAAAPTLQPTTSADVAPISATPTLQPTTSADGTPTAAAPTLQPTTAAGVAPATKAAALRATTPADVAPTAAASTLQPTTTADAAPTTEAAPIAVTSTFQLITTADAPPSTEAAALQPANPADVAPTAVAPTLQPTNTAGAAPTAEADIAVTYTLQHTTTADAPPSTEAAALQPTNPADVAPTAAASTLQPTTTADVTPTAEADVAETNTPPAAAATMPDSTIPPDGNSSAASHCGHVAATEGSTAGKLDVVAALVMAGAAAEASLVPNVHAADSLVASAVAGAVGLSREANHVSLAVAEGAARTFQSGDTALHESSAVDACDAVTTADAESDAWHGNGTASGAACTAESPEQHNACTTHDINGAAAAALAISMASLPAVALPTLAAAEWQHAAYLHGPVNGHALHSTTTTQLMSPQS